jgi:exosortase A-associated hydrolase 1
MGVVMRHLLTLNVAGSRLGATLDGADGTVGLLMVTGGTQTRIGAHRIYERLAAALAEAGHPCLRFDRRGVGDSEGDDPGFRGSGSDLAAAALAFRTAVPGLDRMLGFGLCDGASAAMLFGGDAGLDGLILANPWLVEAQAGAPPPAAIRRRYREQLASREGWKRLVSGQVSLRKLARGLRRAASPERSTLGQEALCALAASRLPARLILSRGDATAIAAQAVWQSGGGRAPSYIETDSHTFARAGDMDALRSAVLAAIADLSGE